MVNKLCADFLMCTWIQGALSSHLCWRGSTAGSSGTTAPGGRMLLPQLYHGCKFWSQRKTVGLSGRSIAWWCMLAGGLVRFRLSPLKPSYPHVLQCSRLFTLGRFLNPVKLAWQDWLRQEHLLLCVPYHLLSLFLCIGRLRIELCAFFYDTKIIFEKFLD